MARRKKRWAYSTGERGRNRVRAFEDGKSGTIFLEFYVRDFVSQGLQRKRVSLGYADRVRAKKAADVTAARFAESGPTVGQYLTLWTLFENYLAIETPQKAERSKPHDFRCARLMAEFFGRGKRADALDPSDFQRFKRDRLSGRLHPPGKRKRTRVGARTVGRDLEFLKAVLNWGWRLRDSEGHRLMDRNPAEEIEVPREASPRRPSVSPDRYMAMLQVAECVGWRFKLALVLAHETGHRISAICALRWCDIDFEACEIAWRRETDKIRHEHRAQATPTAFSALREALRHGPGIGECWILPSHRDPNKPCSRHVMKNWWYRAERLAGLTHIDRLCWHGLRRKFATDFKHHPPADVSHLGGWKRAETVLRLYQQPDPETQRKMLAERTSVRVMEG